MRIHLDTRAPDEPFYFGFDFTPHFATCRLNEPKVLYLSKGIQLLFGKGDPVLRGGPTLEITIKQERTETMSEDEWCAAVVDEAEKLVNAEVLAIPNEVSDMETLQPMVSVFRVGNRLISADMLAEELLLRMQTLRNAATKKLRRLYAIEEPQLASARERCALLNDIAQDGHLEPNSLNTILVQLGAVEPQIERAFFLSNLDDSSEGIRSAILRAAYHLSRMTLALHQVNKLTPIEFVVHDVDHGDTSPRELRHVSKVGDAVADELASAVLATYSALDQTRKLFDFVM